MTAKTIPGNEFFKALGRLEAFAGSGQLGVDPDVVSGIAGQIAHAGVELGKGDDEPIGHARRDTAELCIRPAGCDP